MTDTTVEDRVMIRDLYDRIYWALNTNEPDTIMDLFAPGGVIVRGGVGDTIPASVSAKVAVENASDPVGKTYQHHVSNMIVDPDPEGREDCRAVRIYFMVTAVEEPPAIKIRWSCRAFDTVQKIDGRWKFLKREIVMNHMGTV